MIALIGLVALRSCFIFPFQMVKANTSELMYSKTLHYLCKKTNKFVNIISLKFLVNGLLVFAF